MLYAEMKRNSYKKDSHRRCEPGAILLELGPELMACVINA